MRNRLGRALAAAIVTASLFASVGSAPPALAATVAATGVYTGPAVPTGLADHDSFASWLDAPVPYAVEFLNTWGSWDEVANPYWALDNWAQWTKAQAGRRLVLSVPLLVSSASGQLAQGAAGSFDTVFRALAQNMVARGLGSSVIRLGWEMNNSAFPWWAGSDPAAFRSYYARVVTVMRSVPGTAFSFDWNPNLGVQGGSPLTSFESFYPGDAYVDIIGLDVYDIKWMDSTSSPAARWEWTKTQRLGLDEHRAFAAARAKPVSFPEWGLYKTGDQLGGGGDNPYFIGSMSDWIASGNSAYQAYFDDDWGGGSLSSFPNAKAEFKIRFGATTTSPVESPVLSLSDIRVSSVTATSAVVTWTSSVAASSEVRFGTLLPTSTVVGDDGVISHRVVLTNLTRRTRYQYEVQSRSGDATAKSALGSFTTAKR